MYTIGYISLSSQLDEERKRAFNVLQCIIRPIEKEKINLLFEVEDCLLDKIDTLIVEDVDFSDINWICELIMKVRKQSDIPLWISAPSDVLSKTSRIVYLQLGADGILDQDDDLDEAILIVRNCINRFKQPRLKGNPKRTTLATGVEAFQLIPQNLSVCLENGKEVNLTKLEFLTIEYLHKHACKTMTYEEIYQNVWNDTYKNRKYRVSNLVCHLRQKIEMDIEHPKYIKTIRSKGYMLNIKQQN
ncbi:winged helix-turn-helix domain-containing protein [Enterococcus sp. 5H]|uniref:winged helix-turn-helix domain-containing protein n=1 Tax=Enterococcus sp. 5H TaxID=1229490 RepID=UPI0023039B22|nr:winged helix-turn-helix domain-containing protein [Enterococcus sp. 5H]MDA9472129.1 Alkaline phosphatase synthesis transcriptional regulatory protein PhoP [Enterococcus sp. 5H]